ncbi:MAG: Spermidine/putrescine import ATP-binding protein PotA [Firmicutes bacterium ADurb.BinA052]|jgi:iron(III) transport system ATP-binding protein|nr:MAG: Spermidine/putrescine import ATP-binding protein PotA [Firmicutes bacterium ADurb.BinA052]
MAKGIELEGVSKVFRHPERGDVHAVKQLNLTVQPGELVTLLGPSGCGKTTALRMIAGFENPTTGRILIGGQDVTDTMPNRRNIGFVFQNYALFPHMSVFDNVSYGLSVKGVPKAERRERVAHVLDLVGLQGMERRFPNQLSGGEQQRVALARVIVTEPSVLLLDEPLSNLDAKRRVQMRSEIRRLQRSLNMTSVYVTHDQEEALSISDRVVVMNLGEMEQEGTPQEIYAHPESQFVAGFIGKVNALPAEVVRVDRDEVTASFGATSFTVCGPSMSIAVGQRVSLLIRPESVDLSSEPDGPAPKGRIVQVTYLGEKAEYDIECDGAQLKAVSFDPARHGMFAHGQEVYLHMQGGSMILTDQ